MSMVYIRMDICQSKNRGMSDSVKADVRIHSSEEIKTDVGDRGDIKKFTVQREFQDRIC